MSQELATSLTSRENILQNEQTLQELENILLLSSDAPFSKKDVAQALTIEASIIDDYVARYGDELCSSGYQPLDEGIHTETFSFRAFINLAMLVVESEQARKIRNQIFDVAIGVAARMQGGYADFNATKHYTTQNAITKASTSNFDEFLQEHSQNLQEQIKVKETLEVFKRLKDR